MSIKLVETCDIQGAQTFDGIGWMMRESKVGSTEDVSFKLNAQPPHLIFFPLYDHIIRIKFFDWLYPVSTLNASFNDYHN